MIGIGSDHNGFELKSRLRAHLTARGQQIWDFGCFSHETVDYPDIAAAVAEAVRERRIERAVPICGTGLGMALAANKVPGVYAAAVTDPRVARLARERNNAQTITLGATVVRPEMACEIVTAWLDVEFRGGDSARKIARIRALEERWAGAAALVVGGAP
jgi:RpiB/LacA/LacB family sugar-phosphate isomerase